MGLAFSLNQVAAALADRDPTEAEKLYRRAIELYQGLISASPSVPIYASRWYAAQGALVELLTKLGRQAESEEQRLREVRFVRELERDHHGETVELAIADSNFSRGDTLFNGGQRQQALPMFAKAAALYEKLAAHPDSTPRVHEMLGYCYQNMAGLENHRKAIRLFAKLATEDPSRGNYQASRAFSECSIGNALAKDRDFGEAEASFLRAIEIDSRLVAQAPDSAYYSGCLGRDKQDYYRMLLDSGRDSDAEAVVRQALEHFSVSMANEPNRPWWQNCAGWAARDLSGIMQRSNRTEEAVEAMRQSVEFLERTAELSPADLEMRENARNIGVEFGRVLLKWASVLQSTGKQKEAAEVIDQVFEINQKWKSGVANNVHHMFALAQCDNDLAAMLNATNRPAEAEQAYRQTLPVMEKLVADAPTNFDYRLHLGQTYLGLASLLRAANQPQAAETLFGQALALYEKMAIDFPSTDRRWLVFARQAQVLAASNRPSEADEAVRKAIEVAPSNPMTLNNEAWVFATSVDASARHAGLEVALAKKAIELEPNQGMFWKTLGAAQYRAGNWQESIAALQKALALRQGGDSSEWFFLAMAHHQLGHSDEARKWIDMAVEWMDKNQPTNEELLRFRAEAEELMGLRSPVETR
jgi:tetratricopeptide (TPR) repeat protein